MQGKSFFQVGFWSCQTRDFIVLMLTSSVSSLADFLFTADGSWQRSEAATEKGML
jgi:hypothetical protein